VTTLRSRITAVFLAALVGSALLSGCARAVAEQSTLHCPVASDAPLALAISRRANSSEVLSPVIEQVVDQFVSGIPASDHGGPVVSVLNVDGRPEVLRGGAVSFVSDAENPAALDEDRENFVATVSGIVARVRADHPEVDVLAALEQAAIAAGRNNGRGTLVFSDSGLSTKGALNFRQPGLLEAPPADVVTFLEREHELPNLKGLSVFLVIEPVEPPQADLGQYRANVVELLQMIAKKGGAACVAVTEEPATAGPHLDHLPPVSLVPVPRAAVFSAPCSGVLKDTGDVAFNPGEATFREPAKARAVLEPVGRALRDGTCSRIVLTGTTARYGPAAGQRAFALKRAKAVKQVLVTEYGVDPASIETVGLGSYFTEYQPDIGPNGELLPGPAQLNRTVRIDPCTPTCPSYALG
jgi:OmpA-OmpF porin, OOP family